MRARYAIISLVLYGCAEVQQWDISKAIELCGSTDNVHYITTLGVVRCSNGRVFDLRKEAK